MNELYRVFGSIGKAEAILWKKKNGGGGGKKREEEEEEEEEAEEEALKCIKEFTQI